MINVIRTEDRNLSFELNLDVDRALAGLVDLQSNHHWPKVPLAVLEIFDRAQQRIDVVSQFDILKIDELADCVKVSLGCKASGIKVAIELRLAGGEFCVRMQPSEIVEARHELYRLFSVDVLPGMMLADQTGQLLLPINTGVICEPASAPACNDRFLIYGEQSRWELLPTLPVCAVQTPQGGLTAIAVSAPAETECRIRTDGRGNGSTGLGFFLRGKDVDLVEPSVREIRYTPIPARADMTVFTAGRLRQHVMEDLGKPTLRQRAAESKEVEHLLGAYIMKLFFGMQMQGHALPGHATGDSTGFLVTMTFDEASIGLKSFHDAGVDKIYTQNVGWNLLGHDGAYPTRFPVEPRVGGEQAFRRFIAYGHELGYQMTVHDNYIDAYAASKDFDPDVVTVDAYGQMQIRGFWGGGPSYLQWPLAFTKKHLEEQMLKVKALGIRGPYYLDGMGSPLYQNYHPKHRGTRSDLARGIDRLLKAGRSIFGSAATENGFLYCSITPDLVANPGGDGLLKLCKPDWPITPLLKRCVPLWQLTLSGLVVTENQGLSWTDTMRALLYAQHPRYEWATRPGIQPVLDKAMIQKIKYRYDLLIKRFGYLRLLQMTGYQRVDELETTTFEDGTIVAANFASGELTVNGERIEQPAIFYVASHTIKESFERHVAARLSEASPKKTIRSGHPSLAGAAKPRLAAAQGEPMRGQVPGPQPI